jgi:O-antigen ligase
MMLNRTGLVLLTVTAFAMPVIGVFSSKAMTPLLAVMTLAVLLCHPDRRALLQPRSFPGRALPALAFLVWAGLSVVWAVTPDRSLHVLGGSAVLFIGAVICLTGMNRLSGDNRQRFLTALAAGLLIAVLMMLFESYTGYRLTRLVRWLDWPDVIKPGTGGLNLAAFMKNGIVIAIAVLWPAAVWLWCRGYRTAAVFLPLCLTAVILKNAHHTALVALLAGMTVFALHLLQPVLIRKLLLTIAVLWIAVAPPVMAVLVEKGAATDADQRPAGLPSSLIGRLVIWDFSVEKIAEKPVAGWGIGSARDIPGGREKVDIMERHPDGGLRVLFTDFRLPLHPHNQLLQVWLELGAVGAAGLAAMLIALFWPSRHHQVHRLVSATEGACLAGLFVFANSSFGLWQNWWIALCLLALAWCRCLDPDNP